MFMTDSDLRKQSSWEERLLSAPATKAHLHFFQPTGETAVRAANSQCSSTVSAEGWVAVGDAAAAFDPISSLGIGFALRSGIEAARVAAAAVEQDDGPVAAYAESVARIYADYRRRLRAIYRRERRWPRALFWSRRQY
jgi:flavin-dependent dehydrogenase